MPVAVSSAFEASYLNKTYQECHWGSKLTKQKVLKVLSFAVPIPQLTAWETLAEPLPTPLEASQVVTWWIHIHLQEVGHICQSTSLSCYMDKVLYTTDMAPLLSAGSNSA